MKLLSFSIILGSLLFSFHYVWINRIEILKLDDRSTIIYNKWTGNHCVFSHLKRMRNDTRFTDEINSCEVDKNGKIRYP